MRCYRLRFRNRDVDLPAGEHLVGRATECFIRIEQAMVSRRHARLVVGEEVFFEDLKSRNGSLVNGRPVQGPRRLTPGDRILIGSEEFSLALAEPTAEWRRVALPTDSGSDEGPTSVDAHFHKLANLGESQIQSGQLTEAEGKIERALAELEADITGGYEPTAPVIDEALGRACRMARLTHKLAWLGWIFKFAAKVQIVLPASTIDELQALLREQPLDATAELKAYLAEIVPRMSLTEENRFRAARIEQLEPLMRRPSAPDAAPP